MTMTQPPPTMKPTAPAPAEALNADATQSALKSQPTVTGTPDLSTNPAQASTTAANTTTPGLNPALAQQIAQAISLGLAPTPSNAAGWAKLIDYYSTSAGRDQVMLAEQNQGSATPAQPQGQPSQPLGTNAFLAAIRQHESGGNYKAYNAGGGASGAYQFIQSTWNSEATAAGFAQYAGKPAGDAPPEVQDAVAAHMANAYYTQYGSWQDAAEAWYDPADVGKNVVPAPGAGNTESVTAYGQQIVALMGQQPQLDPGHPAAGATSNVVKIASSQIGAPYVWGGEEAIGPATKGSFDCSGLVQWVYGQAGDKLPRVAQAQYDATPKIAQGQTLQPGDLLFFGSGPKGIEHVGIYIGNNQMIDAPHTGADVRVDDNPTSWGNYVGATRPADPTGQSTGAPASQAATTASNSANQFGQILESVTKQLATLEQQYPGIFATLEPAGAPTPGQPKAPVQAATLPQAAA